MEELLKYIKEVIKQEGDLREFTYKKHQCVIIRVPMGHLCGYVRIPYNSKHTTEGYDVDLEVHGGITFNDKFHNQDVYGKREGHWLGFDTAHCMDLSLHSLESGYEFSNVIYRDMNYVELECKKLVEQLLGGKND